MNDDRFAVQAARDVQDLVAGLGGPPDPPRARDPRRRQVLGGAAALVVAVGAAVLTARDDGDTAVEVAGPGTDTSQPAQSSTSTSSLPDMTTSTAGDDPGALTTVPTSALVPGDWPNYVGLEYEDVPPMPADVEGHGLLSLTPMGANPSYAVAQIVQPSQHVLLFQQRLGVSDSGRWRVVDVVVVAIDAADSWLYPDRCTVNGTYERNVVAILLNAGLTPAEQQPSHAWQLDFETKQAQVLDASTIRCHVPVG